MDGFTDQTSGRENVPDGATQTVLNADISNIYAALDLKTPGQTGGLTKKRFLAALARQGVRANDARLGGMKETLAKLDDADVIGLENFAEMVRPCTDLVDRAAKDELVIPDFEDFAREIEMIYSACLANEGGEVADYIPQLARVAPNQFGVSICTADGQRASFGDAETPFCVQSSCKPINYAIALEALGEAYVHRHVGREPSGRSFNELELNYKRLPHNPMINAGAIMCCSLIEREKPLADRFDTVMETWRALAGGERAGYNNSVYLSEKATADRNHALAYFMRENGAFPDDTNILETLDFYFQCCSIESTTDKMAVVAATLANAGVCPTTGERVFANDTVKDCLSLMYSCGMYDFSGEFAFSVGVPAKSGVSGILMVVIPEVMGLAVWSPRLDKHGNSVRGVEFCRRLVERFAFHNYDNIAQRTDRIDPRMPRDRQETDYTFHLIRAAAQGDLNEISRLTAFGVDLGAADYDGRTALHLAASDGRMEVVEHLLNCGVDHLARDRWGQTAYDDAVRHGWSDVANRVFAGNSGG